MSGLIQLKIKLDQAFMLKGSDQKQQRKGVDTIFPIISQWGLSVAMEMRALIQSAPKH